VPHADLVTIPDADHTLQITKPRQVAEAIAAFLQHDSQPDLAESAGR
jgi:pimeloyl-ACP methyl ester carboxylesterase